MEILYLTALIGSLVAATLGLHSLLPTPAQVHELRAESADRAERAAITSPLLRLLWPLLTLVAPFVKNLGSEEYRAAKARELPLAGLPPVMRIEHFLALKVVMAVALPVLGAMQVALLRNPLLFVGAAALSYWLPDRLVTEWRHGREMQIVKAMPPAVDTLTLSVEAGLDFLSGLRRVIEKAPPGPLREEINTLVNDIRLGASRADALRALGERINVSEVVSFVGVLVQADRLGTPIAEVLRNQADRLRAERFVRAEKAGAAASQKLLVPLAVFIFPAVLLVMIAPPMLNFLFDSPL